MITAVRTSMFADTTSTTPTTGGTTTGGTTAGTGVAKP